MQVNGCGRTMCTSLVMVNERGVLGTICTLAMCLEIDRSTGKTRLITDVADVTSMHIVGLNHITGVHVIQHDGEEGRGILPVLCNAVQVPSGV